MKTGFMVPSCTYNIILSEEDIKHLLEFGYISKNPTKTEGTFNDGQGCVYKSSGHYLIYAPDFDKEEYPVQYVGIGLESHNSKKGEK